MHSRETINKTKRLLTEWEKIFANDISGKWLISKYTKNSYNTTLKQKSKQQQQQNTTSLKHGQRTWTDIFPKKISERAKGHVKRCSTSLIIIKVQIKTILSIISHLSQWLLSKRQEIISLKEKEIATHPVLLPGKFHGQRSRVGYSPWGRVTKSRTRLNHFTNKFDKDMEKRKLFWRMVQLIWKTVWSFFKQLKIELPYDHSILLLGIYTQKGKTRIQKDTRGTMFTAPLFTIAKVCNEPKCHWWMDKVRVCVCMCVCVILITGYYSSIKIMKSCHFWEHGWPEMVLCLVK